MIEEYRKRGSVVRWENGRVIAVVENGVAREEGDWFECRPGDGERMPLLDAAGVIQAAREVRDLVGGGVAVERLVITRGVAEHRFGSAEWNEETLRLHLALTRGGARALVDLGSHDVRAIEPVVLALSRCEATERPAPPRLRLAPAVTAALLPRLVGIAPPNVRLLQSAPGIDGKGSPVGEAVVSGDPAPNWYRPSYRVRPVRLPFNLRLECDVTSIDEDRPIAVALMAPPEDLGGHVLVADGSRAYRARFRLTRIDAVGTARVWYPYAAGSFGAEMML